MRFHVLSAITFLAVAGPMGNVAGQTDIAREHHLADSMQRKLDHIDRNAMQAHPDPAPTTITEDEINDYLAAGRVELPEGVKRVKFQGQSGVITALATIDFDDMRAVQPAYNPLLQLFSGTHQVRMEADGAASGGQARIHVRGVNVDGIDVPESVLEAFLDAYVTPKYPNFGIDSVFRLADRIAFVAVGDHTLTVTQR